MATNKPNPESNNLVPEQRGYSSDPISLAIARDVLRRVREGKLSSHEDEQQNNNQCRYK